jgi:hypothetical protein
VLTVLASYPEVDDLGTSPIFRLYSQVIASGHLPLPIAEFRAAGFTLGRKSRIGAGDRYVQGAIVRRLRRVPLQSQLESVFCAPGQKGS